MGRLLVFNLVILFRICKLDNLVEIMIGKVVVFS